VDDENINGDTAVWFLSAQMAAFGFPPVNDDEPISTTTSSFTAQVMRLGCSGGQTGTVLPPAIVWMDDRVSVTFRVEALPKEGAYDCPSNDLVAYTVELGEPIGQRKLVDGGCVADDAAGSSYCQNLALRWDPKDAGAVETIASIPPPTTIAVSAVVPADTAPPTLNLEGVPPASVAMVISEHLNSVQQAVRAEVGNDVFAGSAFTNDANDQMIIYATDVDTVTAALDRLDTPLRDRITVGETRYSVNDIESYAADAQRILDAAGIKGSAWIQYGVDAVTIQLETPDGQPDEALQAQASNLLDDIPVVITFSGPEILL
jgi:hypothetical protein